VRILRHAIVGIGLFNRSGVAQVTTLLGGGDLLFGYGALLNFAPVSVQKILLPSCRIKKTLIASWIITLKPPTKIPQFEGHTMRKIASVVGVAVVAAATFLSPAPATAENGQIAAGVVGGLIGGALLGGALASRAAPPPPVYYAPAPVYVEEPACRFVRERYWDGYGWVYRRVEVCD